MRTRNTSGEGVDVTELQRKGEGVGSPTAGGTSNETLENHGSGRGAGSVGRHRSSASERRSGRLVRRWLHRRSLQLPRLESVHTPGRLRPAVVRNRGAGGTEERGRQLRQLRGAGRLEGAGADTQRHLRPGVEHLNAVARVLQRQGQRRHLYSIRMERDDNLMLLTVRALRVTWFILVGLGVWLFANSIVTVVWPVAYVALVRGVAVTEFIVRDRTKVRQS